MASFSTMEANKWLVPIRKEDSPIIRLIAFHWVGGNGFVYRSWKKDLPEGIEIYSMMLPGRLSRRKEEFVKSVDEVVAHLLLSMEDLKFTGASQPPTVFFGHSFGGIIAYELAVELQKQKLINVSHLVVSSTNSPEVLTSRSKSNDDFIYKKFHKLSEGDLERELIKQGALLGGLHIDILRASLPSIRADYTALETYTSSPKNLSGDRCTEHSESLFCGSMSVWGGSGDLHNVSAESLQGWSAHVSAEQRFVLKLFNGSHFYFTEEEARHEFIEELIKICLASQHS